MDDAHSPTETLQAAEQLFTQLNAVVAASAEQARQALAMHASIVASLRESLAQEQEMECTRTILHESGVLLEQLGRERLAKVEGAAARSDA